MTDKTTKNTTTPPIRLGILVSGGGTTMLNIAQHIESGQLNAQIAIVIASNNKGVAIERAQQHGFKAVTVPRKQYDSIKTFSEEIWRLIRQADVDLVCLAGFLSLINIPDDYTNKVMNIHPALLPDFGGKGMYGHRVHQAVIKSGCTTTGCTVHFADAKYDHGPIILQLTCPVQPDDTPDTLAARVFQQECIAYPQAIKMFAQGEIKI